MLSAREANRRYFHEAYLTGEHGWAAGKPSPYAADFLRRLKREASATLPVFYRPDVLQFVDAAAEFVGVFPIVGFGGYVD